MNSDDNHNNGPDSASRTPSSGVDDATLSPPESASATATEVVAGGSDPSDGGASTPTGEQVSAMDLAAGSPEATDTDPEVQAARAAFDSDSPSESQAVPEAAAESTSPELSTPELSTPAESTTDAATESTASGDAEYVDVDDEGAGEDEATESSSQLAEVAEPFVGQWNNLISTTNWEKGKIISEWRAALIATSAAATEYSDEAWAQKVGGVTAPHVGRLRRVHDRFGETFTSYQGLYWSHFFAALDWDDAPMWLEGAVAEKWSVSGMRQQRWQAEGAVESKRPSDSQIVEVEMDEGMTAADRESGASEGDVQGEGEKQREYDNDTGDVASGPVYEAPDFGEEEELSALGGTSGEDAGGGVALAEQENSDAPVQPFAGLPELPADMQEAVESLKLSVLRHKSAGWESVSLENVEKYLEAMAVLARA